MKAQFLKLAGVKTEKEFYKKFPTEKAFMAKYGKKIKAQTGITATQTANFQDLNPGASMPVDGSGFGDVLKGLGGGNPVGKIVDIFQGFKAQKEKVNVANQNAQVMGHMEDATISNREDEQRNLRDARMQTYVRPEDNVITGEELFPINGVGTNVLARKGRRVRKQKQETENERLLRMEKEGHFLPKSQGGKAKLQSGGNISHRNLADPITAIEGNQTILDNSYSTSSKDNINGINFGKYAGKDYFQLGNKVNGQHTIVNSENYPHNYSSMKESMNELRKLNPGINLSMNYSKTPITNDVNAYQNVSPKGTLAGNDMRYGGKIKAEGGFMGMSGEQWGNFGQQAAGPLTDLAMNKMNVGGDMGSQLGGELGGAAGKLIGGPVGEQLGKIAGTLIGDGLDRSDTRIAKYNGQANRSINNMIGMGAGNFFQNKFSANAKNGATMKYNDGGDIQILGEGSLTPISDNPYGGEMNMINGPSHKQDGVDMSVYDQRIEAEGGEPIIKMEDGGSVDNSGEEAAVIMGNLKIPGHVKNAIQSFSGEKFSGSKYKNVTKSLGKIENKTNKTIENNINKADNYTTLRPLDRISLNTLDVNIKIADKKLQKLQVAKEALATAQEAQNEQEQTHIMPDGSEMPGATHNAKYGKKLYAQDGEQLGAAKAFKNVSRNDSGLYGNVSPDELENFKMRNNWYDFDGFDPTKRGDVTKLQEAYNQRTKGRKIKVDGKFGPQTASLFLSEPVSKIGAAGINSGLDSELMPIPNSESGEPLSVGTPGKKGDFDWANLFNQVPQLFKGTDAEEFSNAQLLPEAWAMANNKLEPVQSQKYQPRLRTPYDISLQDQLNNNTSKARSAERLAAHNPGMLANLKAQEYQADQGVLGNQFRQNQGFKDQIYSGNLQTLNDASLKNLAIADTQYTRQAQAKSNTKSTDFEAIKSMTDKRLKHNLENQTLRVMENMYDYRFNPAGRAQYRGPSANFNDWVAYNDSLGGRQPTKESYEEWSRNNAGQITGKSKSSVSTKTNDFNGVISKNGMLVKSYKKFK